MIMASMGGLLKKTISVQILIEDVDIHFLPPFSAWEPNPGMATSCMLLCAEELKVNAYENALFLLKLAKLLDPLTPDHTLHTALTLLLYGDVENCVNVLLYYFADALPEQRNYDKILKLIESFDRAFPTVQDFLKRHDIYLKLHRALIDPDWRAQNPPYNMLPSPIRVSSIETLALTAAQLTFQSYIKNQYGQALYYALLALEVDPTIEKTKDMVAILLLFNQEWIQAAQLMALLLMSKGDLQVMPWLRDILSGQEARELVHNDFMAHLKQALTKRERLNPVLLAVLDEIDYDLRFQAA